MKKRFLAIALLFMLLLSGCATARVEVPIDRDSPVYCFATDTISELFSDALIEEDVFMFGAIIGDASTIEIYRTVDVKILEDGSKRAGFDAPSKIRIVSGIYEGEECWLPQYYVEK